MRTDIALPRDSAITDGAKVHAQIYDFLSRTFKNVPARVTGQEAGSNGLNQHVLLDYRTEDDGKTLVIVLKCKVPRGALLNNASLIDNFLSFDLDLRGLDVCDRCSIILDWQSPTNQRYFLMDHELEGRLTITPGESYRKRIDLRITA